MSVPLAARVLADQAFSRAAGARLMVQGAVALTAVSAMALLWPRPVAWPLGVLCFWLALSLLLRARRR